MASCGISLNLSSLESKITANISAMLGIAGIVGLPFTTSGLLIGIALANGNFLAAIQIMVPADALDGLWSGLREEFAGAFSLADAPDTSAFLDNALDATFGADRVSDAAGYFDYATDAATSGGDSFFSKLADISTDFVSGASKFAKETGLDQLSGYIDIDVTDLAKTAIGLGGSWDSCNFGTGGIQNFFKDPSTGAIKLLANYAPKLGDASVAQSNSSWGMTAAVNSIFQSGKTSVKLQLQTAIGNVVSSAVGEGVDYSLNELGVTKLDERDISNMKQHINNYISPNPSLQVMKGPDGTRSVISTQNTALLRSKIVNSFSASEHLNVMNIKEKYPDVFANININF